MSITPIFALLSLVAFLIGSAWRHAAREAKAGETTYHEHREKANAGRRHMIHWQWRELLCLLAILSIMVAGLYAAR